MLTQQHEPAEFLLQATDGFISAEQSPAPDLVLADLETAHRVNSASAQHSLRTTELRSYIPNVSPPPAAEVPELVQHLLRWYQQANNMQPLLRATLLFLQLVKIRPFCDSNTAMALFVMNQSLQQAGLLPINIEKKMRPFLRYAIHRYLEFDSSNAAVTLFAEIELQALYDQFPHAAQSLHNHNLRLGLDGPCSRVIP